MDTDTLACTLSLRLCESYPALLCDRYKLSPDEISDKEGWEIVELIGRKRGFLVSGGEIDFERSAKMMLDEFRSGAIGKITLEKPEG
jgi:ribosome biogenesis GTPase A